MLCMCVVEGARHLEILGRTLSFEKTCGHILDVSYAELCDKVTIEFVLTSYIPLLIKARTCLQCKVGLC